MNQIQRKSHLAYQILKYVFIIILIVGGLDKFTNYLTNWEKYVASELDFFNDPRKSSIAIGILEVITGIGLFFRTKIFAYLAALCFFSIILNLLLLGNYYDVALTAFALSSTAIALAIMSDEFKR